MESQKVFVANSKDAFGIQSVRLQLTRLPPHQLQLYLHCVQPSLVVRLHLQPWLQLSFLQL